MAKKLSKPYREMNAKELADATLEFDEEFVIKTFRPLSKEGRAAHLRARRRGGRPRIGAGAKVISVSVEQSLLKRADALAKKRGVSRARLISEGLSMVLAKGG